MGCKKQAQQVDPAPEALGKASSILLGDEVKVSQVTRAQGDQGLPLLRCCSKSVPDPLRQHSARH